MYIMNDGKILYFKNSKCFKNHFKLKRSPHKLKWTATHRAVKKSEK